MGELFTHAMVVASAFNPSLASGDGTADDPFVDTSDPFGDGSDPFGGTDPFGGSTDPFSQSGPGGAFSVFFGIVVVVILLGIAVAIYRAVKLAQQGKNPLTLDNDIQAEVLDTLRSHNRTSGAAEAPLVSSDATAAPTLEQRLREVDDLRARGLISEAEHTAARSAILAG